MFLDDKNMHLLNKHQFIEVMRGKQNQSPKSGGKGWRWSHFRTYLVFSFHSTSTQQISRAGSYCSTLQIFEHTEKQKNYQRTNERWKVKRFPFFPFSFRSFFLSRLQDYVHQWSMRITHKRKGQYCTVLYWITITNSWVWIAWEHTTSRSFHHQ
jgi:hypothetical protein